MWTIRSCRVPKQMVVPRGLWKASTVVLLVPFLLANTAAVQNGNEHHIHAMPNLKQRRSIKLRICHPPSPPTLSLSLSFHSVLSCRGGQNDNGKGGNFFKSPYYELNPNYVPPPSMNKVQTLGDITPEGVSRYPPQQHQQHSQDSIYVQSYKQYSFSKQLPIQERIKQYVINLHRTCPTLSVISGLCIVIFLGWQMRPFQSFLQQYFVCTSNNIIGVPWYSFRWTSIVLSSVSHFNLFHLLVNLYVFLNLGPTIQYMLSTSSQWPIWSLCLGASMVGSMTHLLFTSSHQTSGGSGGCLGLSDVTLSLLAMYARFYPERILTMFVFGIIPVSMSAKNLILAIFGLSLAGVLLPNHQSNIGHLAHLGGLTFGLLYYELWSRRYRLQQQYQKLMWRIRHSKVL